MSNGYNKELLDEISEIIDIKREISTKQKVPVIFDGNQYTIKIPKKLAESAQIDGSSYFEFRAISTYTKQGPKTILGGKLEKNTA